MIPYINPDFGEVTVRSQLSIPKRYEDQLSLELQVVP